MPFVYTVYPNVQKIRVMNCNDTQTLNLYLTTHPKHFWLQTYNDNNSFISQTQIHSLSWHMVKYLILYIIHMGSRNHNNWWTSKTLFDRLLQCVLKFHNKFWIHYYNHFMYASWKFWAIDILHWKVYLR